MFDFYFQSGDFGGNSGTDWWSVSATFFGSLIGAAIGVGGAIWVFKKTKEDQENNDSLVRKTSNLNKIIYLNFLFTKAKDSIINLISTINKANSHFDVNKGITLPIITISAINSLERIVKSINQEEYFLAYIERFDDQNIEIVLHNFDNAYKYIVDIEKALETNKRHTQDILKVLSNEKKSILNLIKNIVNNNNTNIDILIKSKFDEYISKNIQNNNLDSYLKFNEDLIIPLLGVLKDEKFNKMSYVNLTASLESYRTRINAIRNMNRYALQAIVKHKEALELSLEAMNPYIVRIKSYINNI